MSQSCRTCKLTLSPSFNGAVHEQRTRCNAIVDSATVAILGLDSVLASMGVFISTVGLVMSASSLGDGDTKKLDEQQDDEVIWGVATVVSLIPYFNWLVRTGLVP